MTIQFDAASNNLSGTGTSPLSWTHTPSGTPKGVLIQAGNTVDNTDDTGAVTYGGVACDEVTNSPYTAGGRSITSHVLKSSVPTGAQTVSISFSGSDIHGGVAYTFTTTSGDIEVESTSTVQASFSTISSLGPIAIGTNDSFVAQFFMLGDNNTNNFSPLSGWTQVAENKWGTSNTGGAYYYNTVGQADVTYGCTYGGSSRYEFFVVALYETAGSGPTGRGHLLLLGVS